MKQVLIVLTKAEDNALTKYLKSNLGKEVNFTLAAWSDLSLFIGPQQFEAYFGNQPLNKPDFVWLRRTINTCHPMAKAFALYLETSKIQYFDRAWSMNKIGGDKMVNSAILSLAGLPVMPSYFCFAEKISSNKIKIIERFGFPIIAKNIQKNRGEGICLFKKEADFTNLIKVAEVGEIYLFQKFYPNNGDFRIVVLGNEVVAWERRIAASGDFRNNASRGGREEFYPVADIPQEIASLSIQAAQALGLQVAGVDVLTDKETGKNWMMEVNRAPGFTTDLNISPELPAVASFFKRFLKLSNG